MLATKVIFMARSVLFKHGVGCSSDDIDRLLDPDNGLSDTRTALAIMKRMALDSWELLAKFYRQNYNVMGTIRDPEPQSDHDNE